MTLSHRDAHFENPRLLEFTVVASRWSSRGSALNQDLGAPAERGQRACTRSDVVKTHPIGGSRDVPHENLAIRFQRDPRGLRRSESADSPWELRPDLLTNDSRCDGMVA